MMRIAIGQFNVADGRKAPIRPADRRARRANEHAQASRRNSLGSQDLRQLVEKCESFDLKLEAIENVPIHFYDKAMLGLPGKDEQIANYQTTVRNMADAGIPILGYPLDAKLGLADNRPGAGTRRRACHGLRYGGASNSAGGANSFVAKTDERLATLVVEDEPSLTHDQMWENFAYFMNAVLPIAEEVGVKIALASRRSAGSDAGWRAAHFWQRRRLRKGRSRSPTARPSVSISVSGAARRCRADASM